MPLTLRAIALNDSPLSQPITASFDERGGSIGRADTNTLALPDPERHISRVQVQLSWRGAEALVTNVGGPNPVLVNGRLLEQRASAPLAPGGQLQIGGYKLLIEGAAPAAPPPGTRAASADFSTGFGLGAEAIGQSPFDILAPSAPLAPAPVPKPRGPRTTSVPRRSEPAAPAVAPLADDPFAMLNDDFLSPPAGVAPGSKALKPDFAPAPTPEDLPDPFAAAPAKAADEAFDPDHWAASSPEPATPGRAQAQRCVELKGRPQEPGMTWLRDLGGPAPEGSGIDHLIDPLPGDSARDPLDDFLSEGPRSPAPRERRPIDERVEPWDEPMPQPPAPAARPPGPPRTPAAGAAKPPRAEAPPAVHPVPTQILPARPDAGGKSAPPPAAAPVAAVPKGPAGPADGALLWQAFCEGAGIVGQVDGPLTPQRMRELGALLRASVDGVHALVMMRARSKEEMNTAVTQIRASANNPLKFSVDGRAALEQVLRPPLRGFIDGPAAMREACDDVLAHAIGTVAGMQAALLGVLDRFEPEALERKLSSRSMLDAVLPAARKARLWELYVQHAAALREEAGEDFDALYGKAFRKAYEAQIDRLHDKR
jgi:FHA domain-containing protein